MDLDYDPRIPDDLLRDLERAARELGLPLHVIELLGQDRAVARGFLEACTNDRGPAFMDEVDLDRLERVLEARQHAERLARSPRGVPDLPGFLPVG